MPKNKVEYESLFPNDILKEEVEAIYQKLKKINQETGKNHPVFQNGNVERDGKTYRETQQYLIFIQPFINTKGAFDDFNIIYPIRICIRTGTYRK